MRCPKCGYISFDHAEFCKNCHQPLGDVAQKLNGAAYNFIAPSLLTIPPALHVSSADDAAEHLAPKSNDSELTLTSEDEDSNLTIDFGDLDISDLVPTDGTQPEEPAPVASPALPPSPANSPAAPKQQKLSLQGGERNMDASSFALEDLDLGGMNLTTSAESLLEKHAEGQPRPSDLKTGTALDQFNVDSLLELEVDKNEKKN